MFRDSENNTKGSDAPAQTVKPESHQGGFSKNWFRMSAAAGDVEYRLAEEQDFNQVSTIIFYSTVKNVKSYFYSVFHH